MKLEGDRIGKSVTDGSICKVYAKWRIAILGKSSIINEYELTSDNNIRRAIHFGNVDLDISKVGRMTVNLVPCRCCSYIGCKTSCICRLVGYIVNQWILIIYSADGRVIESNRCGIIACDIVTISRNNEK